MARDFKILDREFVDWLFIDPHMQYPSKCISYRHVISHSLFELLNKNKKTDELKNMLTALKKAFDDDEKYINDDFVHLYKINSDDRGFVLIDRTSWCYPLVFNNKERTSGLYNAISNIENRFNDYVNVLKKHQAWSDKTQKDLNLLDSRNTKHKQ